MTTKKSVLIISYYWPPAGGPGVQRWLKFAKYLPSFNWEPIIYTPENPNYPIIDNSLLDEIPKNIKIHFLFEAYNGKNRIKKEIKRGIKRFFYPIKLKKTKNTNLGTLPTCRKVK